MLRSGGGDCQSFGESHHAVEEVTLGGELAAPLFLFLAAQCIMALAESEWRRDGHYSANLSLLTHYRNNLSFLDNVKFQTAFFKLLT